MSKRPNDGGPAFPCPPDATVTVTKEGMSLRDWFAGQALGGLMADPREKRCDPSKPLEPQLRACAAEYAQASYRMADAMLAERAKEPPE